MNTYIVKNFTKGQVTRIEKESIPKGAMDDSLNWVSLGDRVELRRGYAIMGTSITDVGRVKGLIVGVRDDGTQIPIVSNESVKIKYFDSVTSDWIESSLASIIPSAAEDDDMAFSNYQSLAGSMIYGSSKNSSVYKIMLANPGSVIDMGMKNHRGKIRIKQNRTFLWDRKDTNGGSDKSGLYGSYIDHDELSDYTEVVAEAVGTGDGSAVTFTGTLTMSKTNKVVTADATLNTLNAVAHGFSNGDLLKFSSTTTLPAGIVAGQVYFVISAAADVFKISLTPGGPAVDITDTGTGTHTATFSVRRTVMYVRFTDGVESFIDDRNGNLTGNLGGTGTINYATGAYSITFTTAPTLAAPITSSYYWEDSFVQGIMDFSKSVPRTAGQGFVFRQDDGGAEFQNLGSIDGDEYCFHKLKTWRLTLSDDDTNATNPIYRARVGIPNWRAMAETGDGLYYVDASDISNPFIRLLRTGSVNPTVLPKSISDNIDLSGFRFDRSAVREWGLYIIVACRTSDSTINNRLLMYHKLWQSWNVMDYRASCLEEYGGVLIAGDDGSNDVSQLFSNFSDDDSNINNQLTFGNSNLDAEGVKKFKKFVISGLISQDQAFTIYFSYDNGEFVEVGQITGNGDYVDQSQVFTIGANMVGSETIGSPTEGSISASPYRREFDVNTDIFEFIRIRVEATEIGYLSISEYQCKDMRYKGKRLPMKARRG